VTIFERRAKLPAQFKAKTVRQRGWAGLSETEHVKAALNELVECGYLREIEQKTGGRPSVSYEWRPEFQEKKTENTLGTPPLNPPKVL
jgi:hypothetical protein